LKQLVARLGVEVTARPPPLESIPLAASRLWKTKQKEQKQ
jgi:hypothetical protein